MTPKGPWLACARSIPGGLSPTLRTSWDLTGQKSLRSMQRACAKPVCRSDRRRVVACGASACRVARPFDLLYVEADIELPPSHSITSSARVSSEGGTVSPSALAVLRLITSLKLVGCWTGRLLGCSPFRMRDAYTPS